MLYLIGNFLYFWSVYVGWFFIGTFARLHCSKIAWRIESDDTTNHFCRCNLVLLDCGRLDYRLVGVCSGIAGVVAHGLRSPFPVVLASLTKYQSKAGVRAGMGFSIVVSRSAPDQGTRNSDKIFQGLAVLSGSQIAGVLVERDNGKFIGLQVFSATSMVAAVAVLLLVEWVVFAGKEKRYEQSA